LASAGGSGRLPTRNGPELPLVKQRVESIRATALTRARRSDALRDVPAFLLQRPVAEEL
jgi:hypothetical protein